MEAPRQLQLSAEAIVLFQEGISLVLSKWYALQLAVENGWGGPHSRDKAHDLASRIFSFFHQPNRKEPPYIDDLETLLYEGMDAFNTDVEDGSVEEVAEQLMVMHEECLERNYQSIRKLREVRAVPVRHVKQAADESDEEEDDLNVENSEASNMMVDSPGSLPNPHPAPVAKNEGGSHQMAEDDDGWVVVGSRKNKGRRN